MIDLAKLVKPLVWEEQEVDRGDGSSDWTGVHEAHGQFGAYVIDCGFGSDCYYWAAQSPEGADLGSDFEDLDQAKAVAQADYTARIVAAMDPYAPPPSVTDAMVDAALLSTLGRPYPSKQMMRAALEAALRVME